MQARLSGSLGITGRSAVRALLVLDITVGLVGLGIGMGAEVEVGARLGNLRLAAQATPAGQPREAALDGPAPVLERVHVSAAEFAAALRTGEATFGTWDPDLKAFVVELSADRPAPI